jgi:hypothetical protein
MMPKAFHLKRLLRLADHLDTVKNEDFDLTTWHRNRGSCGTVACAVGHACTIPSFRRAGLFLKPVDDYYHVSDAEPSLKGCSSVMETLREFFGIDDTTIDQLFMPSAYEGCPTKVTPRRVAKQIRRMVDRIKKEGGICARP